MRLSRAFSMEFFIFIYLLTLFVFLLFMAFKSVSLHNRPETRASLSIIDSQVMDTAAQFPHSFNPHRLTLNSSTNIRKEKEPVPVVQTRQSFK